MFWEKNEKHVDDYVEIGETLPSSDRYFQKTIYLFAGAQELMTNQYKCVLKYKTLTGETLTTVSKELELHYRAQSHSHARHSKWGSNDEDDYDEDDYDEEDYDDDDDDDDDDEEEDDWQHQFSHRKRFS
ncbi:late secretory pathway protein AVL9-like [Colossoma macropomum]|uniref:late secretory pathway protein AVL9-like n=1 Tax=Colossoma macropomum TaxID=42526 RepID=UPI001865035B|nr:late secretory pathway protein AVL9-like [Colossoma macropomum]